MGLWPAGLCNPKTPILTWPRPHRLARTESAALAILADWGAVEFEDTREEAEPEEDADVPIISHLVRMVDALAG